MTTDFSVSDFFSPSHPDGIVRSGDAAIRDLTSRLTEITDSVIRPRVRRTVTEFAEQEIVLKAENGEPIPGKYRQINNPVAKVPQDALGDPEVLEAVLIACAQGGKSRSLANFVASKIVDDPENIIVAYPVESTAKEKAKTDFFPMFKSVDSVRKRVFESATDKHDKTSLMQVRYPGGFLKFPTTASPSQTASTPSGCAIIDEYSRVEDTDEGDPRMALRARMSRFVFYKLIVASTLVGKNCRTMQAYKETDMSVPLLPCPKCGHEHKMTFANIDIGRHLVEKVDDKGNLIVDPETGEFELVPGDINPEDCTYRCPSCSYSMPDSVRYHALEGVLWKQTAPFFCCGRKHKPVVDGNFLGPWDEEGICVCPVCEKRPVGIKDKRGFRWSVLYTKTPLRQVIGVFKEAEKNPVKLQQFWNDWMAEEFEIEAKIAKTGVELLNRAEDYEQIYGPGVEVPEEVLGLFSTLDINSSYGLDFNLRGFGLGEESWGVHYEKILGDVEDWTKDGPWYRAEQLRRQLWHGIRDDEGLRVYRSLLMAVDINDYATVEHGKRYVYPRIGKGVIPIKGRAAGPLWNPTASLLGRHTDAHYPVGSIAGKTIIHGRLRITDDGPGKYHWPADEIDIEGNVVKSHGYGEGYMTELANLKSRPNHSHSNGSPDRFIPEVKSVRQEAWDTEIYILAAVKAYVASKGLRSIDDLKPTWRYLHEIEKEDAVEEKDLVDARRKRPVRVNPNPKKPDGPKPVPVQRDPRARGDRI